jgi:hypothetical protein
VPVIAEDIVDDRRVGWRSVPRLLHRSKALAMHAQEGVGAALASRPGFDVAKHVPSQVGCREPEDAIRHEDAVGLVEQVATRIGEHVLDHVFRVHHLHTIGCKWQHGDLRE